MRKILFSIAVLFAMCIVNANSQVLVRTIQDDEFFGIKISENDSSITLLSEELVEMKIKKNIIILTELKNCTIQLNNGVEYYGRFGEYSTPKSKFILDGGAEVEINTKDIKKISSGSSNSPKLGLTLGTPSGINLYAGIDLSQKFAISLQGFYLSTVHGVQINGIYNFKKNKNFEHGLGFGIGSSYLEDEKEIHSYYTEYNETEVKTWDYVGAFYELNYYGFYANAGVSVGNGSYSSPQLLFQIGYVYRFNK